MGNRLRIQIRRWREMNVTLNYDLNINIFTFVRLDLSRRQNPAGRATRGIHTTNVPMTPESKVSGRAQ